MTGSHSEDVPAGPEHVVGEAVFYSKSMQDAVVTRVWKDKPSMKRAVDMVFRDASQVSVDYKAMCADEVEMIDQHAWYEICWYEHDRMRQIVPQADLDGKSGPGCPREMVTEEQTACYLPKPSEWHEFAADYEA